MNLYCEHNRELDSYGNPDCPRCEIIFLHKELADCERRKKKWRDKNKQLQKENEQLKESLRIIDSNFFGYISLGSVSKKKLIRVVYSQTRKGMR